MEEFARICAPSMAFDISQNRVSQIGVAQGFVNESTLFSSMQIKTLEAEGALFIWRQSEALAVLNQHPESTLILTFILENLTFFTITDTLEWTQDKVGVFTDLSKKIQFETGLRYAPSPVQIFDLGGSDPSQVGGATACDKVELGLIQGGGLKKSRLAFDKIRYSFAAKRFLNNKSNEIKLCAGLFDAADIKVQLEIQHNGQSLFQSRHKIHIKEKKLALPFQKNIAIQTHIFPGKEPSMTLGMMMPFPLPSFDGPLHFEVHEHFESFRLRNTDALNWTLTKDKLVYLYTPISQEEKFQLIRTLLPPGNQNHPQSLIQLLSSNFLETGQPAQNLYLQIIKVIAQGQLFLDFSVNINFETRVPLLRFMAAVDATEFRLPTPLQFFKQPHIPVQHRLELLAFYLRFQTGQAPIYVNIISKTMQEIEALAERLKMPVRVKLC